MDLLEVDPVRIDRLHDEALASSADSGSFSIDTPSLMLRQGGEAISGVFGHS
jgi:hypothetical protein